MYTTFGSFKRAGACNDGNKRFLRMIGNSSTHLSGLDHRIPVWLPLIMNPNDGEDISWMFKPELTYVHDENDFRHMFNRTRHMVLRYGLMNVLFSIHLQHNHGDEVWGFASNRFSYDIKSNKEKAQALVDLANEITRVLRPEIQTSDDQLRAVWRRFERVCANHINPTIHEPDAIDSPNGNDYMVTGRDKFNNMYNPLRMAVMEDDEGEIRASMTDQLYYAHFTLRNIFNLGQWADGIGIDVNDKPGRKDGKILNDRPPVKPEKRPRETTSAFVRRMTTYTEDLHAYTEAQALLKKNKSEVDPFDVITRISDHPALYGFKCYFVGERDVNAAAEPEKSKKVIKSKVASPKKKFIRLRDEDDGEEDLEINYDSDTGVPLSQAAIEKAETEDVFTNYDRQFIAEKRAAEAYKSDVHNYVMEKGKPKFDRFGRHVLDSRSYFWRRNNNKWTIDWVHANFPTHLFFDSLRVRNEQAMPETVTPDYLAAQEKPISVHVARTETGEFTAGMIAVNSPRVLLQVMKLLSEISEDSSVEDLTPSTVQRRSFRERMIAAAQERNREALDELAAQPELAPAPVLEDPVPVATMPSPAPVVQLADAVFGRPNRRPSRSRVASMN